MRRQAKNSATSAAPMKSGRYGSSTVRLPIHAPLKLDDGTYCDEASHLAEHKLQDVREKMADLARMETALSELVCACHARKGNVSCPLIASLQGGASPAMP